MPQLHLGAHAHHDIDFPSPPRKEYPNLCSQFLAVLSRDNGILPRESKCRYNDLIEFHDRKLLLWWYREIGLPDIYKHQEAHSRYPEVSNGHGDLLSSKGKSTESHEVMFISYESYHFCKIRSLPTAMWQWQDLLAGRVVYNADSACTALAVLYTALLQSSL